MTNNYDAIKPRDSSMGLLRIYAALIKSCLMNQNVGFLEGGPLVRGLHKRGGLWRGRLAPGLPSVCLCITLLK